MRVIPDDDRIRRVPLQFAIFSGPRAPAGSVSVSPGLTEEQQTPLSGSKSRGSAANAVATCAKHVRRQ